MANVITNDNIRTFVGYYITNNRNILPDWLQGIPIGDWDVSRVTNMNSLFRHYTNFNEPLGNWDVSNVTNMQDMFDGCINFNQPLDNWNVSNVTNMESIFGRCTNFNQPLNNWDVSNVTNMNRMFIRCTNFNQPLDNWNISRVISMVNIFCLCINFNQPLENWNVSNVTNMAGMFEECTNFNQPLGNWNVSNVTHMRSMFEGCRSFNQPLDNWDVSNVRNMGDMFKDCVNLNINPGWQVNPQTIIHGIFENTPLHGTLLRLGPQQAPHPQPQRQQPAQQLPRGLAYEIHNAFPELNFNRFMTIITRDNNGASNFKDTRYPLEPLITYINNDTSTTLHATEKTGLTSDLNGEIKTRLNMYLSEHPETKDNVMEMTQFVMSQGPDYKDPYIRFLTYDCMNAYGPGSASCTKGVFERIFLINKSVLIPLCSDDTSSSTSSCKQVYRELLGCFYPDMDLNSLFGEWYNINNMEEGSTSPLANASEEERQEDFRRFVLSKVPRADPTALNEYIEKNKNTFKTLLIGGRNRKNRKNRKTLNNSKRRTKRRSLNKGKRKSLRKSKGKTKKRY